MNKSVSREEWERKLDDVQVQKKDMNRLVMNYLVTEGFFDAAKAFSEETGVEGKA